MKFQQRSLFSNKSLRTLLHKVLNTNYRTCNMSVDYLLHESSVGYAIFRTVLMPDTVGARLKEVQDSVQVFGHGSFLFETD